MVSFDEIRKAVEELNSLGVTEKINISGVKRDELVEIFIDTTLKVADEGKEDELTDTIIDVYNALVDEIEAEEENEQENKEQESDKQEQTENLPKGEVEDTKKTEVKLRFRKNSRPHMLYQKILEGKTLDELLSDKELLDKYINRKSWIKADYKKIMEKMNNE